MYTRMRTVSHVRRSTFSMRPREEISTKEIADNRRAERACVAARGGQPTDRPSEASCRAVRSRSRARPLQLPGPSSPATPPRTLPRSLPRTSPRSPSPPPLIPATHPHPSSRPPPHASGSSGSLETTLARHDARSTQRSPGSSGSSLDTTLDWRRLPLHITLNTTPRSRERRRERGKSHRPHAPNTALSTWPGALHCSGTRRPIRRPSRDAVDPVAQYGALHVVQRIPSPNTAPFTWCSGSRRPRPPGEGLGTDGASW